MPPDETLEATYKVRYFVETNPPHIPPQDDKLPKMDCTQAINVATGWLKKDREIDIFDDLLPIFRINQQGVRFVNYKPSHAHFLEHLKIKVELDRVWGECMRKRFQI